MTPSTRATATEFGLAAAVFTRDVDRARRMSREINAGNGVDQHVVRDERRLRRGRLQTKRSRPLRGARGLADFQEIKTYVHLVPPAGD
jgi:betaine-aldehyde dehydrogenase